METGAFQKKLGRRIVGIRSPQRRKVLRESLQLTISEMARLLGIGEAAARRIEQENVALSEQSRRLFEMLHHLQLAGKLQEMVFLAQNEQMSPREFIAMLYRETHQMEDCEEPLYL